MQKITEKLQDFQKQLSETKSKIESQTLVLENLNIRKYQLEGAVYSLQNLLEEVQQENSASNS